MNWTGIRNRFFRKGFSIAQGWGFDFAYLAVDCFLLLESR